MVKNIICKNQLLLSSLFGKISFGFLNPLANCMKTNIVVSWYFRHSARLCRRQKVHEKIDDNFLRRISTFHQHQSKKSTCKLQLQLQISIHFIRSKSNLSPNSNDRSFVKFLSSPLFAANCNDEQTKNGKKLANE